MTADNCSAWTCPVA